MLNFELKTIQHLKFTIQNSTFKIIKDENNKKNNTNNCWSWSKRM